MLAVVGALDGSTVDRRCCDHNIVVEAAFQSLDDAVCFSGVAGRTGSIAADGEGRVRVEASGAPPPLHCKGVDVAVQLCHHSVRQAGSCWAEQTERKKNISASRSSA